MTIASQIIAALDASLELSRAGIFVNLDLLPSVANYADVARTVMIWCEARCATIQLNPELRTSHVMLEGHRVAILYQPHEEQKVVVDVDALRVEGLL